MRLVVVAFVLAFAACKSGASNPETAPTSMEDAYLAIGDKLAADSIEDLDRLAAAIVAGAEPKGAENGIDEVVAGAGRVAAQDIATARNAFKKMSHGMIKYLVAHPQARTNLQLVHCTMTFGGDGGYWVQPSGKVMNPYEGAMMLHCGDPVAWEDAPTT